MKLIQLIDRHEVNNEIEVSAMLYRKKSHHINFFVYALVLFLTQQIFLRDYNIVMHILTLLIISQSLVKKKMTATSFLIFYLTINLLGSIAYWENVNNSLRFYAILIATILAFQVESTHPPVKTLLGIGAIQAALVFFIGAYLMIFQNTPIANDWRAFVLENNFGDIYSFNGFYYRVQLIGNALIPFLFMISYTKRRESKIFKYFSFLYFSALVFCGNFTFFIAIAIYIFIISSRTSKIYIFTAIICASPILIEQLNEILLIKFEGNTSSMAIRFDQMNSIVKKFVQYPLFLITGFGLGSSMPDGTLRNYSSDRYIELQFLYIFFQIGLLGIALYLVSVFYSVRKYLTNENAIIFIIYIIYSSTNPYMFDTTHVFVVLLLTMLSNTDRLKNIVTRRRSVG